MINKTASWYIFCIFVIPDTKNFEEAPDIGLSNMGFVNTTAAEQTSRMNVFSQAIFVS